MNLKRIFLGGTISAVIMFVVSGFANGLLFRAEFEAWVKEMGPLLHPFDQPALLWITMSLLSGLTGVWIYAAIRPRFGAGPKTALFAGLALWVGSKLTVALDLLALGLLTRPLIFSQLAIGFVGIMVGTLAGAWIYKEAA